jgi:hypothetical protein
MADRNDRSLDDVSANAYQASNNYYAPYMQTPVMSNPYGGYASHLAPLVTPPMPVMFSNPGLAASYQMGYPSASMMAGFQGTSQGNYPQAQYLTPPNLGGFRNIPPSPIGAGAFRQRPQSPYMPFAPMPSMSEFTRPEVMAYQYAQQASRYGSAQEIAAMNAGATALTGIAGAGIGAGIGGYFGGVNGARIGAAAGGIFANAIPGLHGLVSDMFQPALRDYGYGARLSQASSRYMVGGQGLDISGQGMALPGAMRVGRAAGDIAEQSRGTFNRRDIVNITQYSGDIGLLDQAHNADQVIESVRNISKVVATFARIVGDPDIKRSIALMGEMRRMGGSTSDMLSAMRGMDQAARAAGTDITGLMERGGRPGALAFQNMGLSGFEGMRVGAQSLASAQQAVNTGSVSTLQLGLMGGVSGMAQSRTNAVAGFLGGQGLAQMMPFLVKHGANGLELDQRRIQELMTSGGTLSSIVSRGSGNIRGPMDIQALQTQMPELRSQFAAAVGPEMMPMMQMNVARMIQREMGGNVTLATAMQHAFGMSGTEASSFVKQYQNPETYKNMRQQVGLEDARRRVENADQLSRSPGAMTRLGRSLARTTGIHAVGEMWDNAYAGVGDFLASREQAAKDAAFGLNVTRFGDVGGDINTPGGFSRRRVDLSRTGGGVGDMFHNALTSVGLNEAQRATLEHTGGVAGFVAGTGLLGSALVNAFSIPVTTDRNRLGESFRRLTSDLDRKATNQHKNAQLLGQLDSVTARQANDSANTAIGALKKKGISEHATQAFIDAFGNSLATTATREGNLFGGGANAGQATTVAIQEALSSLSPKDQEKMKAALQSDPKLLNHVMAAGSQVTKDLVGEEGWNRLNNKARGAAGETEAISGADSIERIHSQTLKSQKNIMDTILSGGTGGVGTFARNLLFGNRREQTATQLQGLAAEAAKSGGNESWVAAALLGGKGLTAFRKGLTGAQQDKFADFMARTGIGSEKFRTLREDLKGQKQDVLAAGIGALEDTTVEAKRHIIENTLGVKNTNELREQFGHKGESDEALYARLGQNVDTSQATNMTREMAKTGAAGGADTQQRVANIDAFAKEFTRRESEQPGGGMAVVADSFESSTKDFASAVDKFTSAVGGKTATDQVGDAWDTVKGVFSSVTDYVTR